MSAHDANEGGRPAGGGEMAERIRAYDWSTTAIGPIESWSPALRMQVAFLLANRFPMLLWCGPSFVSIYNDAYAPILGAKHPWALGRPVSECWSEIWDVLRPLIETPFAGGPPTWIEDFDLELRRHGYLEEGHFTVAYSPVPDESAPRGIGGVVATVHEISATVFARRRVAALRELGSRAAEARSASEACAIAAATLAEHGRDLPFALLYLLDADGATATLAGAAGVEAGLDISPLAVDLRAGAQRWPFADALRAADPVVVDGLAARFAAVPKGPWSDPPHVAVVTSLASVNPQEPAGVLVAGISSRLPLDEPYRDFLALLRTQLSTAIANARAYEEEKRRAEALAELDRAKTVFFSNVSHEFRTPLTLMLGPVEDLLARGEADLSPSAARQLEVVNRNGMRLLRLVNSLLQFARIEAGRVRATFQPTDLAAATAELASVFRAAIERAGLRLIVDCPPLDAPVHVDPAMWEQIVLNLVSNAFKFTLEGEIEVRLRSGGDSALLTVRDTGAGIPADEMPRLFQRFHRVNNARSRTHEGSGIGLALVQELVRLHGGTIDAASQLDSGTTFTVRVPLGSTHLPPDQVVAVPGPVPATAAPAFVEEALQWLPDAPQAPADDGGARPLVLVADDNADMRRYLERLLGETARVAIAADGEQALAAARERAPDLIVTDVMMPRLDGFGLLRALRGDPSTRDVPVIMLSARAGEEARIEGLERGADDYLIKPFTARELLARVQSQLELARLRRAERQAVGKQNERLRLLWEAAAVLLTTDEPDAMLRGLFAKIRGSLGLDVYFNFMVTDAGDALGLVSCAGIPDDVARSIASLEFGQAVCGTVALRRQPIVATRIQESAEPMVQLVKGFGIRAYACNPLIAGGTLLGTLSFASRSRDSFEQDEVEFLETISHYVTIAYERLRLIDQLRDQDRRKDEFLATLAHELRNPLAPIRNGLQLIAMAPGDAPTLDQARSMMQRQVQQMVRLVDDLLDVSRISRDKLELRKERVELTSIVGNAIETSRPAIEAGGHEFTVSLPREPVLLDADPVRLAQAISNLLNNAAKYTERGGRIAFVAERAGREVVLRVRDTGIGIPADRLPHIFKLFVQVERSLERSQGGLGIGLTLVERLIRMHGGSVEAHSDGPGRGSEFVVRLPLVGAAEPGAIEPASIAQRSARTHAPRRVLVVDDNRDAADSLSLVLAQRGHEVSTAYDGLDALDRFAEFRPDVVLLDLGMPKVSGFDVARRIREQRDRAGVLLIALSGWGQEQDKARTREAGFDAHVVKPVDLAQLETLLAGAGSALSV